jgi:transcriptional regulator with XRE-family HTH domain
MRDPRRVAREALRFCGARIAEHRRSLELSRLDLAEITGLHVNTISNIERAEVDTSLLATSQVFIRLGCVSVRVLEDGLDPSEPGIDPREGSYGAVSVSRPEMVAITGARIRQRRKELGMSIEDLAGRSALHRNTVWNCERGLVVPSMGNLYRIFRALGVDEINGGDGARATDGRCGYFLLG